MAGSPGKRSDKLKLLRPMEPRPVVGGFTAGLLLALQAFEAAYRLGSFRAAADMLHVTPSAISHRIRYLERVTGDALFVRAHRAVTPTLAGRTLATATGRAFTELGRAVVRRDAPVATTRLRLAVAPPFEVFWLLPRIPAFLDAHPDIELVIESVSRRIDFDNEPFDATICGGGGEWPGMATQRLMRIFTTPICTPAMAKTLKLRSPSDLRRSTLIHVTTYPLAWPLWFDHAGVGDVTPRRTLWVDSFGAAQHAAERGVGVALGLDPLFAENEGRCLLVRPLPARNPTGDFWFVHRPLDARNPALRTFKQWIVASAANGKVPSGSSVNVAHE